MITYEKLSRHSSAFKSLTGMSVEGFEPLFEAFVVAHLARLQQTPTKRDGQPRKRAVGCGRSYTHSLRDRLVMALVWLRMYPTYEMLGFFFSLHKTNARQNVEDVLETLLSMTVFGFERPAKERPKLSSLKAVMDAFPEVVLVIDSKEQRIRRPSGSGGEDEASPRSFPASLPSDQRPYFSGKKKAHTLKTQVAVRPDGLIEAVSESVPGSTHDLTLLRQSRLLEKLELDEGAMFDKAYDGIEKDHPDLPLYIPFKARRNRPLTEEEKIYNAFLSSYRIVVEHTNAQLQKFQALAQVYRHDRNKHSRTVRVVAGLVNRQVEKQPLKTYLPV
jgi:hypothetical protein